MMDDMDKDLTTYQTDPKTYQVSTMHNPCEVTERGSPVKTHHTTSILQEGEIEEDPEPRVRSPKKTEQVVASPQRVEH
jgi:hypothetical protein